MAARNANERAPARNIEAAEVATPNEREIVITRFFDAPRVLVFAAWTKAEHVAHWWDPSGAPLATCEIDLRPNGAFRWVHRAADGEGHAFAGVYLEIVAPEKLVFAVDMFASRPAPIATLRFAEAENRTKLTIAMTCETKEDRDALLRMRVDSGTAQTLENLAVYLPEIA